MFFRSRCSLGIEILALRQQLGVLVWSSYSVHSAKSRQASPILEWQNVNPWNARLPSSLIKDPQFCDELFEALPLSLLEPSKIGPLIKSQTEVKVLSF